MHSKKLLILDLDETLIHGSLYPLEHEADDTSLWCYLYKRPYVVDFMRFCRENFRVAIWTTATREHAEFCIHHICEQGYPFEFVWTRERCSVVRNQEGKYGSSGYHWIKPLAKIKRHGFSLQHTIMLDDTPSVLSRNYGNLVRIEKFRGDLMDMELLRVMPYLLDLKGEQNIRALEKRGWRTRYAIPRSVHDVERWIKDCKELSRSNS